MIPSLEAPAWVFLLWVPAVEDILRQEEIPDQFTGEVSMAEVLTGVVHMKARMLSLSTLARVPRRRLLLLHHHRWHLLHHRRLTQ